MEIETPELDKQSAVLDDAAKLSDFYDWLAMDQGIQLCTLDESKTWGSPRYLPDSRSPEQLLADYFGIDRDKIETERRAILDALRGGDEA